MFRGDQDSNIRYDICFRLILSDGRSHGCWHWVGARNLHCLRQKRKNHSRTITTIKLRCFTKQFPSVIWKLQESSLVCAYESINGLRLKYHPLCFIRGQRQTHFGRAAGACFATSLDHRDEVFDRFNRNSRITRSSYCSSSSSLSFSIKPTRRCQASTRARLPRATSAMIGCNASDSCRCVPMYPERMSPIRSESLR